MTAPAEPILASSLWESQQSSKKARDSAAIVTQAKPETGVPALDDALSQYLHYGTINCIHAEPASGQKELCNAIMTSHLLQTPRSTATVIDVSSFFDVRKIHHTIASRMGGDDSARNKAVQVLDRLNIMQVFDFEGLTDAIAEVRQALEKPIDSPTIDRQPLNPPKSTINDSEDEDDILDDPTPAPPTLPSTSPSSRPTPPALLLTNFHHIISPLLKTNHIQGQSLLISFTRSLHHLTQTHNLCTIILSGMTSYPKARDEGPSAFASCPWRPVLGKAFSHLLDSEMLLYRAQGRVGGGESKDQDAPSVLEVLQNRNGMGMGRWAPFGVDAEGGLKEFV